MEKISGIESPLSIFEEKVGKPIISRVGFREHSEHIVWQSTFCLTRSETWVRSKN